MPIPYIYPLIISNGQALNHLQVNLHGIGFKSDQRPLNARLKYTAKYRLQLHAKQFEAIYYGNHTCTHPLSASRTSTYDWHVIWGTVQTWSARPVVPSPMIHITLHTHMQSGYYLYHRQNCWLSTFLLYTDTQVQSHGNLNESLMMHSTHHGPTWAILMQLETADRLPNTWSYPMQSIHSITVELRYMYVYTTGQYMNFVS